MEPRLSFKNRKELLAFGSSFHLCLKFLNLTSLIKKAHAYGFVENGEVWTYSCQILQGDFYMAVSITPDNVSFQVLIRKRVTSILKYIWKVCVGVLLQVSVEACLEILYQIRKACFDVQDFICPQTKRIMDQIQEKYGDQLEYLWRKVA